MKYFLIFFISVSVMISKYETQKYRVILSDEEFEIRFYDSSIKAKVVSNKSANGNFYKLFQFISGNNSTGEKIAMTTPVYMKEDGDKNTMEFVMPSNYKLETITQPTDKDVVIFESEAKHFACVKYGGYSNSNKFDIHSEKLVKKLKKLNIDMKGDIFYVSYNSPYKLFNRRNEAMVEINYEN